MHASADRLPRRNGFDVARFVLLTKENKIDAAFYATAPSLSADADHHMLEHLPFNVALRRPRPPHARASTLQRRSLQTATTTCSSIYPSTSLFADRDHHMLEHVASRVAVADVATDMFERQDWSHLHLAANSIRSATRGLLRSAERNR
jgi:hypothetical protein